MKKLLKRFLGIDKIEKQLVTIEKQFESWRKLLQVGVDVHPRTSSWAVVCLKGKTEYVEIFNLSENGIHDIQQFLRQFDRKNTTIDLPHGSFRAFF